MMEGAEVGSSNGLENRGNQYVVNGSMPSLSATIRILWGVKQSGYCRCLLNSRFLRYGMRIETSAPRQYLEAI